MAGSSGKGKTAKTIARPEKPGRSVSEQLDALGCDPIEGMAEIAMDTDNNNTLRAGMYKELAQYVAAKNKTTKSTEQTDEAMQNRSRMDLSGYSDEELRDLRAIHNRARARDTD